MGFGILIQADGSPHDWFEGRSENGIAVGQCTLLVFIDDASGRLMHLEFARSESNISYFRATKTYLKQHGKPLALYVDKHGVFRVNKRLDGSADTSDTTGQTQFKRAMDELDIQVICANSPQAKGRVERMNSSLQNRLVKWMRIMKINSIEVANAALPKFIAKYNRQFEVVPRSSINAHRPLSQTEQQELDFTLSNQEIRIVSKDLTVHYQNKIYQLKVGKMGYKYRKAKIKVVEDINGIITILYGKQPVPYEVVEQRPKALIADSKGIVVLMDQIKQKLTQSSQSIQPKLSYFDQGSQTAWNDYLYGQ